MKTKKMRQRYMFVVVLLPLLELIRNIIYSLTLISYKKTNISALMIFEQMVTMAQKIYFRYQKKKMPKAKV